MSLKLKRGRNRDKAGSIPSVLTPPQKWKKKNSALVEPRESSAKGTFLIPPSGETESSGSSAGSASTAHNAKSFSPQFKNWYRWLINTKRQISK